MSDSIGLSLGLERRKVIASGIGRTILHILYGRGLKALLAFAALHTVEIVKSIEKSLEMRCGSEKDQYMEYLM
jgi:hypothetical protein